jgi:hypothetical protein
VSCSLLQSSSWQRPIQADPGATEKFLQSYELVDAHLRKSSEDHQEEQVSLALPPHSCLVDGEVLAVEGCRSQVRIEEFKLAAPSLSRGGGKIHRSCSEGGSIHMQVLRSRGQLRATTPRRGSRPLLPHPVVMSGVEQYQRRWSHATQRYISRRPPWFSFHSDMSPYSLGYQSCALQPMGGPSLAQLRPIIKSSGNQGLQISRLMTSAPEDRSVQTCQQRCSGQRRSDQEMDSRQS